MKTDARGLSDLYRRAAQIVITPEGQTRYPNGVDVLSAEPRVPPLPATRKEAVPHLLLVGPFQDAPDLLGVDIYAGIGFIEVRKRGEAQYDCGLRAIAGAGYEARISYLETTIGLYAKDKSQ